MANTRSVLSQSLSLRRELLYTAPEHAAESAKDDTAHVSTAAPASCVTALPA